MSDKKWGTSEDGEPFLYNPEPITTLEELKRFIQRETLAMSQEVLARLTDFENRTTDALNTIETNEAGGLTAGEVAQIEPIIQANTEHAETIADGGAPPANPSRARRR